MSIEKERVSNAVEETEALSKEKLKTPILI